MSMTREEAIKCLKTIQRWTPDWDDLEDGLSYWDAIDMALTALRPISREQVEKVWRGEWEWYDEEVGSPLDGIEREWGWRCSKCKVVLPDDFDDPDNPPAMRFCQWCGAPMTDEAVQMVLTRLNELSDRLLASTSIAP